MMLITFSAQKTGFSNKTTILQIKKDQLDNFVQYTGKFKYILAKKNILSLTIKICCGF